MSAGNPSSDAQFTLSAWGADGAASLEATGSNRRAVLEAALRAVLVLLGAASSRTADSDDVRSAPIRGEGDDLALLFSDLVDDLLDQADFFRAGLQDVALDGLVRRDDGGFVAWGYASGMPGGGEHLSSLSLAGPPTVNELESAGIVIRAVFARGGERPRSRPTLTP